nr:hypothetical protein [Terasakiella brassicae]
MVYQTPSYVLRLFVPSRLEIKLLQIVSVSLSIHYGLSGTVKMVVAYPQIDWQNDNHLSGVFQTRNG